MATAREIEAARRAADLSILFMCTALDLDSAEEYAKLLSGRLALSVYQQIMLLVALEDYPAATQSLRQHDVYQKIAQSSTSDE